MRITSACTLALVAVFTLACAPRPAEQPAPSPSPASTAGAPDMAGTASAGDAGSASECAVDADCVPAGCCHASTCAPASAKPDCAGTMCTTVCQPNTMDCGGRCACEAGSCKAILGQP